MYSSERNNGIDWLNILIKLIFIILFVVLLLWLFKKTPNMTTFYSGVFRENINYMQQAAKNYYTNERLPKNEGDTSEMTLQDMIDKSLLLPFVDKDGNVCDTEQSYVQVTKKETEYVLKVNLVCKDESNYIIETLGCHDYCDGCKIEEQIPETPVAQEITEYQFKKSVTTDKTTYSCPEGYELNNKTCYKKGTDKIAATTIYVGGEKVVEDAIKTSDTITKYYYPDGNIATAHYTKKYYCKTGKEFSGSGETLVCKIETQKNYCASGNYDSSTGKCKKLLGDAKAEKYCDTTKISYYYNSENNPEQYPCVQSTYAHYSCVSNCNGQTKRILYDYSQAKQSTKYTCAKGTKVGTKCYDTVAPTCKPGASEINGKCYEDGERTYKTETTYTYSCPSGYTPEGSGKTLKCYKNITVTGSYYCKNSKATLNTTTKKCTYYTDKVISGYTCPEGYKNDGTYCFKENTVQVAATSNTTKVTSYKYQWSISETLDGWVRTGKTRTKKI